jgi:hypothetical protein
MQEVYKRVVPVSAWSSYLCSAVETIAHKSYKNRYVEAGFKAGYEIHKNSKEPWNSMVSFDIHAPEDADSGMIKGLKDHLDDSFALWSKREVEKRERATHITQR